MSRLSFDDLRRARRILCVQPHYDDNDLGAGGTLAALSNAGVELIYLTVTDDLFGVLDATLSAPQALARVQSEQRAAGEIIGVAQQLRLEYPDAGEYSYYELRRQLLSAIRRLQPDFLLTCDPWLAYEAHQDHRRTGFAVAEAAIVYHLPRFPSDPAVDAAWQPYALQGVAFYFTQSPNVWVDIEAGRQKKHRALDCYRAQFTQPEMQDLHRQIEAQERRGGEAAGCEFAEGLRLVRPDDLHVNPFPGGF